MNTVGFNPSFAGKAKEYSNSAPTKKDFDYCRKKINSEYGPNRAIVVAGARGTIIGAAFGWMTYILQSDFANALKKDTTLKRVLSSKYLAPAVAIASCVAVAVRTLPQVITEQKIAKAYKLKVVDKAEDMILSKPEAKLEPEIEPEKMESEAISDIEEKEEIDEIKDETEEVKESSEDEVQTSSEESSEEVSEE